MLFPARYLLLALALVLLGLTACEKEHPTAYEKPITSLLLVLTPEHGGNRVVLSYLDNDGIGGLAPLITGGTLMANTTYNCELIIQQSGSNSSARTKHLIDTTSVMGQPALHQVFYSALHGVKLQARYSDLDENGYPIGFKTTIKTGNPSAGGLQIIIIHTPNKQGENVEQGILENAGGQIDLEATFDVIVQTNK